MLTPDETDDLASRLMEAAYSLRQQTDALRQEAARLVRVANRQRMDASATAGMSELDEIVDLIQPGFNSHPFHNMLAAQMVYAAAARILAAGYRREQSAPETADAGMKGKKE